MKRTRKDRKVAADALLRERDSLLRKNRQAIYLNDQEVAAINEYSRRFGIKNRSALYREAILERVLGQLELNHPTLF